MDYEEPLRRKYSPLAQGDSRVQILDNEEPLTHLMDYPFGLFHSSETPYLTINYVNSAHQINIQQLIL